MLPSGIESVSVPSPGVGSVPAVGVSCARDTLPRNGWAHGLAIVPLDQSASCPWHISVFSVSLGSSECVHTSPNFRITWHMGVFSVSIGSSDYVQDNLAYESIFSLYRV